MTSFRWGSATDVGRRRSNNQDSLLAIDGLFAVADGMGGHAGGEVASLTAVEALRTSFRGESVEALAEALQAANRAVWERAGTDQELRGMGTTLTVVAPIASDGEERLAIANVGDSRAYLFRDGQLTQLTEDHSVPEELRRAGKLTDEEAAMDPRKNVLTRALGQGTDVDPDLWELLPYRGDRILICSDGLTNEVTDDELADVLRREPDPAAAARRLVDMANANGGADNITVVVVDVVDDDDRAETASAALANEPPPRKQGSRLLSAEARNAQLRALNRDDDGPHGAGTDDARWEEETPHEHALPARRFTLRTAAFVLAVVIVLAAAVGAVGWYARGSYYVGIDDGQVAIFKGRPGGLLWFQPTLEQRTDLAAVDLPPARLDAVEAGKTEPSLEEARDYVANLRSVARTTTTTTSTTTPSGPTTSDAP